MLGSPYLVGVYPNRNGGWLRRWLHDKLVLRRLSDHGSSGTGGCAPHNDHLVSYLPLERARAGAADRLNLFFGYRSRATVERDKLGKTRSLRQ